MCWEASPRKATVTEPELKVADSRGDSTARPGAKWEAQVEIPKILILQRAPFTGYARITAGLAQKGDPTRLMRCAEQGFHWPIQRRPVQAASPDSSLEHTGRRRRGRYIRCCDVRSRPRRCSLLDSSLGPAILDYWRKLGGKGQSQIQLVVLELR